MRKGQKHTAEAKAKMSASRLGKKFTEEHRCNISKAQMGVPCPNSRFGEDNSFYGRKHSKESKEKMRKSTIGQVCSEERKLKARAYRHTKEARLKISEANRGAKSTFWQGGIFKDEYPIEFNNILKDEIRDRDNHTCQECGVVEETLSYRLPVHHIDYNKNNNEPDNLVCLCRSCHAKTSFNRDDWTIYYRAMINKEEAG